MRNLLRRVSKLEGNEVLTGPPSIIDRLEAAFDQAAFRLTGRSRAALANDSVREAAVSEEVRKEFIAHLDSADLKALMAALEARLTPAEIERANAKHF
jgi:hypothetical protein